MPLPLGIRNNNPLNIRFVRTNRWIGRASANGIKGFEKFETLDFGIRAAFILIRKYIADGRDTITKIVTRWAPYFENNTSAYISRVVRLTGIDADKRLLLLTDTEQICAIAQAMSVVEVGAAYAPPYEKFREVYKKYWR